MNIINNLATQLRRGLNECQDYNYISPKQRGCSIPFVVHQSYPKKNLSIELKENINALKLVNPDWEFKLYDDDDIERYIESNYPDLIKIYKKINPKYGAARVDFFRYLLIYNEGGVYLDIKSSLSKPLNQIIQKNDQYLLSHWQNDIGDPHENSGIYVDLPNCFGEFQQWYIASIKGHPFLKSVIENVCNNIVRYNPYLHHTGQTGVFRVTGPIAYTLAILPHLAQHPHRLARSNNELNFVYSIFSNDKNYKHRSLFKNHYSSLNESVTKMNYFSRLIFKFFQPIKDWLISVTKRIGHQKL